MKKIILCLFAVMLIFSVIPGVFAYDESLLIVDEYLYFGGSSGSSGSLDTAMYVSQLGLLDVPAVFAEYYNDIVNNVDTGGLNTIEIYHMVSGSPVAVGYATDHRVLMCGQLFNITYYDWFWTIPHPTLEPLSGSSVYRIDSLLDIPDDAYYAIIYIDWEGDGVNDESISYVIVDPRCLSSPPYSSGLYHNDVYNMVNSSSPSSSSSVIQHVSVYRHPWVIPFYGAQFGTAYAYTWVLERNGVYSDVEFSAPTTFGGFRVINYPRLWESGTEDLDVTDVCDPYTDDAYYFLDVKVGGISRVLVWNDETFYLSNVTNSTAVTPVPTKIPTMIPTPSPIPTNPVTGLIDYGVVNFSVQNYKINSVSGNISEFYAYLSDTRSRFAVNNTSIWYESQNGFYNDIDKLCYDTYSSAFGTLMILFTPLTLFLTWLIDVYNFLFSSVLLIEPYFDFPRYVMARFISVVPVVILNVCLTVILFIASLRIYKMAVPFLGGVVDAGAGLGRSVRSAYRRSGSGSGRKKK